METIPVIEEKQVEGEPSQIPFRLQYTIEAPHGKYVIKRPSGTVGARHFTLLARCVPTVYSPDGEPMISPMDEERQYESYEKWVPSVLKHIVVSCPIIDGVQITADTIPPEDQWALFQAVGALMKSSSGPLFRIVDT